MAGDYLQIDCDLPEKPEVHRICDLTGVPIDTVVGRLVMFWRWVDRHASSQNVTGTSRTLARVAGGDEKFWEDVASLNEWLRITSDGIEIPGWKKRFSKSAKNRIKTAERQSRHRAKKSNAGVTPKRDRNVTGALPKEEKRREENRREENTKSEEPPTEVSAETADGGQSAASVPVVDFPVDGKAGKTWWLSQSKLDEYVACYPALDVPAQIRIARQWCIDHPTKRKTPGGMLGFLTRWLNRAQNSPRAGPQEFATAGRPMIDQSAFGGGNDES